MDIFQRIGNLFTGGGFSNDKERRANDEARRRKEEEERRRREAEAARQKAQAKPKTVAPVQDFSNRIPGQNAVPTFNGQKQLQTAKPIAKPVQQKVDPADQKMIDIYNNPVNKLAFDRSRETLKGVLGDPTHRDYQQAKRIAPLIKNNWQDIAINKTLTDTAKFATDIAKTPIDVAQSAVKAPIRIVNQMTGNKKTVLNPFLGTILGAENNEVGDLASYGTESRTGVTGLFGDVNTEQEGIDPFIGLGLSLLDMTPLAGGLAGARVASQQVVKAGGLAGARVASQQVVKAGINRATGARNIMTESDAGGVPEAEVAAAVRQRVAQAEQAVQEVPDAVEVAPGIKSPNLANDARSRAQAALDAVKQAVIPQRPAVAPVVRPAGENLVTPEPIVDEPVPLPQKPRAISQAAVVAQEEAAQAVDDAAKAPAEVTPEVPTATAVETPTEALSKEVDAPAVVAEKTPAPKSTESSVSKDVEHTEGVVKALQERIDYLKRNGEDTKQAEAELRTAKAEVKAAKATAKSAPKVVEEAPVLNKNGKVNAKWLRGRIDEIRNSDASPEAKTAALQNLDTAVSKAEVKTIVRKTVAKDAENPDLTKVQKRARARVATVDAERKVKKPKAVAMSENELPKKVKGKAGGQVGTHMARTAALHGDPNAKAAVNSLPGKKSVSYEKDMQAASEKATKSSLDEVIGSVRSFDAKNLEYDKGVEALAYNSRLAEDISRLSSKKRLSATEKTQLKNAREAQADLYEAVALRVSDDARMQGYLSYIYKSMDPAMITRRVKARLEAANGKMTRTQENQLTKANIQLKAVYDANEVAKSNLDEAQAKLSKDSSPEDIAQLRKLTDEYAKTDEALTHAYDKVNIKTEEIKQYNFEKGHIKKQDWHGRKLDTYQRAAMLSAPSGRIRDLITTNLLTTGDVKVADALESVFGKVFNAISGRKTVGEKFFGNSDVTKNALSKSKADYVGALKGERTKPRFLTGLASSGRNGGIGFDERSGIYTGYSADGRKPSKALSWIHSSVALPTYLTKSYKHNTLYKAGYNDALKRGLSKEQADALGRSYVVSAPEAVYKKAQFKARELSGLQSEVGRWLNRKFQAVDRKINNSGMPTAQKRALANSFTIAKNLTIPFSSYMTGTAQNLLTRQNIGYNAYQFAKATKAKDPQAALEALSQGTWNAAKLAGGYAVLSPLISDTDKNGNSFAPPYLNVGDVSIPIGSLGPLGGQLINAWAVKKATETENAAEAVGSYLFNLTRGVANASGLANLNTTATPLLGAFNALTDPFNDPDKSGRNALSLASDTAADFVTQLIPAVLRDVNSLIDPLTEDSVKPETRVLDDDGKRDYVLSNLAKIGSGIPFVAQSLEDDDEGAKAPNFVERVIGGTAQSDSQKTNAAKAEEKRSAVNQSLSGVLGNDKFRSLLDEDQQKIFDKANDKELKASDLEEVRNALVKTSEKFRDDGDFDAYGTIKRLERDKLKADPKSAKGDVEKLDREIRRADLAKDNKLDARGYKLYSEISNGELNDMLDPDDEEYDPKTAAMLVAIDDLFTKSGVSMNADGQESWKRNKYEATSGGGGARGKKGKSIATDVGTLGDIRTVSAPSLKARALKTYDSPIPNLASQTARTNLKKKITVQKGVHL